MVVGSGIREFMKSSRMSGDIKQDLTADGQLG